MKAFFLPKGLASNTSSLIYINVGKPNDFFEQVWQVTTQIPKGRVTSYGAIAKALGAPRSARMVGYAMNASHSAPYKIPAHRVVNRIGMLSGKHFFETPYRMQELLEQEGLVIKDDCIVNFAACFWDPLTELSLD